MISIIVPVYNVEPYLRKCLDSIINQTYRDLEILIIDDGSTDGSGAICDEYKVDERVKVFHTENRGLSAARNLGLDNTTGEWIGFVDSDDWIEPDMYQVLIKRAEETGADVVECGYYLEYPDRSVIREGKTFTMPGMEAIHALLRLDIYNGVWNRLWKRKCFDNIRFPEGRIHEDVATTYRVFLLAERVCGTDQDKYHYRHRENSLSHLLNMNSLVSLWRSHKERYDDLKDKVSEEDAQELLRCCAYAAARTWAHYYDCKPEERVLFSKEIQEMNEFTRQHFPLLGFNGWSKELRCGIVFPHYNNQLSLRMAWMVSGLHKRIGQIK